MNESEDIEINLMPMNKFVIRFIEIFQNDLNQLIYECGGIVGLWFGIYPVKAVDLLMYSLIPIKTDGQFVTLILRLNLKKLRLKVVRLYAKLYFVLNFL
jgi:hypothetical protein